METKRVGLLLSVFVLNTSIALAAHEAGHAETGGQVFFGFGASFLNDNRGGQVFTDTGGAAGLNDDDTGWAVTAGLDTALVRRLGPGDLVGEILLNYAHFSGNEVRQTTSALLGGTNNSEVKVAELMVLVAPKYRLEFLDGMIRPWIIPAGLAFLVNSPPSNDSTYLDIGYSLGLGVEFRPFSLLSIGVDGRYTFSLEEPNFSASFGTVNGYVGVNF